MIVSFRGLRKLVFGIPLEEVTFARRNFYAHTPAIQHHLENVGRMFVCGYHMALHDSQADRLAAQLNSVEPAMRGFAFEGAAMALALLDQITPWNRRRVAAFLAGPGQDHVYMVHVGIGWAYARLSRNIVRALKHYDPLLGWLLIDGFGFHQGYFEAPRYIDRQFVPTLAHSYARRVFDQGLGRSLWFVRGADIDRLVATVNAFAPERRADLWSGIGLACTYAGGVDQAAIIKLRNAAGTAWVQLAQGAAFAAKARQRAQNLLDHTDMACMVLCGMSADAAAEITDLALRDLPMHASLPAYEIWRQRIQAQLSEEK